MTTISWRLSPAPFRQRPIGGLGETGFADQGGLGGARQGRRARSYAELYGRNRGRRIASPSTAWRHKTVSPSPLDRGYPRSVALLLILLALAVPGSHASAPTAGPSAVPAVRTVTVPRLVGRLLPDARA